MKKQTIWFVLFLVAIIVAACEKPFSNEEENGKSIGGKAVKTTRMVRIRPTELQVETMEEPMNSSKEQSERMMTRAQEKKERIYAVNVYEKKAGESTYSMYAYGLFNNQSKIAIKMSELNQYKVECLIVEDRDDKVYSNSGIYSAPFLHGDSLPTKLTNSFVMSKKENLCVIKDGKTNISASKTMVYPRVVKLYGTVNDFSPKASKDLVIDMKRAVFGLHFKITPPEEGVLSISYLGWRLDVASGSKLYDYEAVYSFKSIEEASQDSYQTTTEFNMIWKKADGSVEKEKTTLTLKRNVMTVIEIAIEGPKAIDFSLREESDKMKTDSLKWRVKL